MHIEVMDRKEYLKKYINGTASEVEKQAVAAWVTGLMARVSTGLATVEEQEIVSYWLSQEENISSVNEEMELRKKETAALLEKYVLPDHGLKKMTAFFRYSAAAVILIVLASTVYFLFPTHQQPEIAMGRPFPAADSIENSHLVYRTSSGDVIKKIELPDSSFIYLNANASISLDSANYNLHSRDLTLNEGEVFFQVAKNAAKKFTVKFDDLQLQVVGTSFNIENYRASDIKKVFVKTGKVILKNKAKHIATLTPGDIFIYDTHSKTFSVKNEPDIDLSQWINGQLLFSDAGIEEIRQKLENRFGTHIVIERNALPETIQLNAMFDRTDNLPKIVKTIADIYNAKVRIDTGEVIFYKQ